MLKRNLEKLRTLNATKSMINALQEPGEVKQYWKSKKNKHRYHLAARCQQLNGILKVSICTREDIEKKIYTPKWDVFLNYEGDEYISRERQKDGSYKWRTAMIYNLEEGYREYNYDMYMYINSEGCRSIQAILNTQKRGYAGICEWQEGCKKRRDDAKIKKLTDQWDEAMKPIKDPPGGFENWWKHNGFDGQNYIFYKGAGAKEGYCTSCLEKVSLDIKPVHNMQSRCPKCHKIVNYISRAKKRVTIETYFKTVSCLQRYKDGLVQRDFWVKRIDISDEGMINKPKFIVDEFRRTLIVGTSYKVYTFEDYKRRGNRWCVRENEQSIERGNTKIYHKNMNQLLKNSHTAFPIAEKNGYRAAGLLFFLIMEKKYPVIEMAYKAGLCELGKDMLNRTWILDQILYKNKHELSKILGIDNARMKRLKQMKGDIRCLIWLQYEKQKNTVFRDCDINTLSKMEIQPETMDRSEVSKHLSIEKICNYIRKQQDVRGRSVKFIWDDWRDYISMMKKLKMDCSNELLLKPKDLTIAHNELAAKMSMNQSKKEITNTEKKYKAAKALLESGELKKYEYQGEKYCIVAPEKIADIYEEGISLKHCIHTCDIYFQRMDIKETYLLFLRKTEAPDRPWYTLEIEPGGNIRQKKSVLNEAYKDLDDAMPFLKKWQQWVKKNLSEEDKKLAEKSDKARRDGYQKLREEKKIIWHGRLQGTLLVDALEDDFMEVI